MPLPVTNNAVMHSPTMSHFQLCPVGQDNALPTPGPFVLWGSRCGLILLRDVRQSKFPPQDIVWRIIETFPFDFDMLVDIKINLD